jgi:hypothetical protein
VTASPPHGDECRIVEHGSCAVCGSPTTVSVRRRDALVDDLSAARRHGHKLMHSTPADVFACDDCGLVFRNPAEVPVDLVDRYRMISTARRNSSGFTAWAEPGMPRTAIGYGRMVSRLVSGSSNWAPTPAGS